jgi:hypothetical protein
MSKFVRSKCWLELQIQHIDAWYWQQTQRKKEQKLLYKLDRMMDIHRFLCL